MFYFVLLLSLIRPVAFWCWPVLVGFALGLILPKRKYCWSIGFGFFVGHFALAFWLDGQAKGRIGDVISDLLHLPDPICLYAIVGLISAISAVLAFLLISSIRIAAGSSRFTLSVFDRPGALRR